MPRKPGPKKEQVLLRLLSEPTMKDLRALAKKRKLTVQMLIAELIKDGLKATANPTSIIVENDVWVKCICGYECLASAWPTHNRLGDSAQQNTVLTDKVHASKIADNSITASKIDPLKLCNHPIGRRIGNGCGQCGKENVK